VAATVGAWVYMPVYHLVGPAITPLWRAVVRAKNALCGKRGGDV
jgi:hypothetical protein